MKNDAGLQGMRGFASLSVVFYHALGGVGLLGAWLFGWGYVGVDLFFVISGFILTKKFLAGDYAREGRFDALTYYMRRIFRIWPLYWLMVPFCALLLQVPLVWQDFLFLQDYAVATFGHLVPWWTLCIEEVFYLFLPLWVLVVGSRYRVAFTLGMVGVAAAWSVGAAMTGTVGQPLHDMVFHQFPMFGFEYALGSLAAQGVVPRIRARWLALMTVPLLFVLSGGWSVVAIYPFLAGPLFYLWVGNLRDHAVFANRAALWLGNLTYPIYLIGLPMLALVGFMTPDALWWTPLTLAGTVALAWGAHVGLERPMMRVGYAVEQRFRAASKGRRSERSPAGN